MDPLVELLIEICFLVFVEGSLVLQILGILHLPVVDIVLVQRTNPRLFLLDGVFSVINQSLLLSLVRYLLMSMLLLKLLRCFLVTLPELLELLPVSLLHLLNLGALLLHFVFQDTLWIVGPRFSFRMLLFSSGQIQHGNLRVTSHSVLIRSCQVLLGHVSAHRISVIRGTLKLSKGLLSRFAWDDVDTLIAPEGVGLASRIVEVKMPTNT